MKILEGRNGKLRIHGALLALVLALGSGAVLIGCADDGPAEEAGEQIDEAVESAGDSLEEAAEEVEEATDGG